MNIVFGFLIIIGIIVGAFTGNLDAINRSTVASAKTAIEIIFSLIGIFTLWLGIAKIAEESGLLKLFTKIIQPLVRLLFPSIPKDHPAIASILMNLSANLFGFGSAATPFGLKAMKELQSLNPHKDTASEAMCTFLAINTSSVTLIPTTIIAVRSAAGSLNPMETVGTTLFATIFSTFFAITLDYTARIFLNKGNK